MYKYVIIVTLFMVSACVPPHQKSSLLINKQKNTNHASTTSKKVGPSTIPNSEPSMDDILKSKSDTFLYMASKAALNDGNYPLARSFLLVLAGRSQQLLPQLELARLYLGAGQAEQAEVLLLPWLNSNPVYHITNEHDNKVVLHGLYVEALIRQHKTDAAITYLKGLVKNNPALMTFHIRLIQGLMTQKSWKKAELFIKQGLKRKEFPILLSLQVETALQQGHTRQALRSIRRLRVLEPDNEKAVILHSNIELQAKKRKKAEKILRRFITSHPTALQVSHRLGQLLTQQSRLADAAHVYEGMLEYAKTKVEIYSTLAMLYYQLKDHRKAADALIEGLRLTPNNGMFHFYLAVNQELLGELDAAARHYKQVSKEHERYGMAQLRLAVIAMNRDKLDSSMSILRAVLKEKPTFGDGWSMLSSLYLQQEAYQKLLDHTEQALKLKRIPNELLLNRAVALDYLKRFDAIDATIGQLLKQSPENAEALNFLGYSLAERGVRLDEAEQYIRRALKKKPNNGFYLDSLAWVFYQQGAYPKAIKTQRQALKEVDDIDPVMFDHLGDMLWRQGNHPAAIKSWKNALSREKNDKRIALEKKIRQGL